MKKLLLIALLVSGCKHYVCVHSHKETSIEMPLSIVVGGSKYGGGVGVPLGDAKEVTNDVCDQWKEVPPK
jgi:hypothetical protein